MADLYWTGASTGNYGTGANWSTGSAPTTNDNVRFHAGSVVAVSLGLNQSAAAIADFIVEAGYSGAMGTTASGVPTYLQLDPNRFEFAGTGISYIDLGGAAIDCEIKNTAGAGAGKRGLYLIGSAIDDLVVQSGQLGIAVIHGSTATVAKAHCLDGSTWFGAGTTLTTLRILGGEVVQRCAATTVNMFGGNFSTEEIGAITTVNAFGGNLKLNSTGTITTLNIYGGANVDMLGSNEPRTITNVVYLPGASALNFRYDPNVITITNAPTLSYPASIGITRI